MEETVLCYIKNNDQYLMLYRNKKKHDLNAGKYIGIGGHIESGETKEEALVREVKEETGLTLQSYRYRAKLIFINDDYEEIMYLFTSDSYTGQITDCNEGELCWKRLADIPKQNMWEGDQYFLELLKEEISYFELELRYKKDKLIKAVRLI